MQDHAIGGTDPDVRRDEGGWISGPCVREPAEGGRRGRYYIEAEAEDRRLEDRLSSIRSREDARQITTVQAAAERIAAMTSHLEAVRELRRLHFDGGRPS
jgi:hypothetical protein